MKNKFCMYKKLKHPFLHLDASFGNGFGLVWLYGIYFMFNLYVVFVIEFGGHRGRDCMVVSFTTTYAISAYHQ
jgi:hypothetical protein